MIGNVYGFYKNHKLLLLLPLISLLIISLLIFNGKVFSLDGSDKAVVYKGDSWEITESFTNKWFMNNDTATFVIDLSQNYRDLQDNAVTRPFVIRASINDVDISPEQISYSKVNESSFQGSYQVKVVTPSEQEGNVKLSLQFLEDNDWLIPVSSHSFSIHKDTTSPELTIKGVENDHLYQNHRDVTFTVTDENIDMSGISIIASKNGEAMDLAPLEKSNSSKASKTYKFSDGVYEVAFQAVDKAGNQTVHETLSFTIDSSAPEIDIEGVDNDGYYQSAEVEIKVNDLLLNLEKTIVTIEKDGEQIYSGASFRLLPIRTIASFTRTFTENGVYQIKVTSKDLLGHTSVEEVVRFTIDKAAPIISIPAIQHKAVYEVGQQVEFIVSDKNLKERGLEITATKDGQTYDFSGSIRWEENKKENTFILNHLFEQEGNYEISLRATDLSGNLATKQLSFIIDTKAPNVTIDGPANNSHVNNSDGVPITVTVEDLTLQKEQTKIWLNGTNVTSDFKVTSESDRKVVYESLFEKDDTYQFEVQATDAFGRETVKQLAFTIDTKAPVLSITRSVVDEEVPFSNVVVKVSDSHIDESSLDVKVTRKDVSEKVVSVPVEPLQVFDGHTIAENLYTFKGDGVYEIELKAKDLAGNLSERSYSFTIDNTKPSIVIEGPTNGLYSNAKDGIPVSISIEDLTLQTDKTFVSVNGKNYKEIMDLVDVTDTKLVYDYTFTEDEAYELIVTSTDQFGNEFSKTMTFTLDTKSPDLLITGVEHQDEFNGEDKVDVTISASDENLDPDKINLSVQRKTIDGKVENVDIEALVVNDSKTVAKNTYTFTEDGEYTIQFQARDKAGNRTVHDAVSFIIDTTLPKVVVEGVRQNQHYNKNRDLVVSIEDMTLDLKNSIVLLQTPNGEKRFSGDRHFDIVDGNPNKAIFTHSIDKDKEGRYSIQVISSDRVGYTRTTTPIDFVVDTTAPEISLTGKDQNGKSITSSNRFIKNGEVTIKVVEEYFETNEVEVVVVHNGTEQLKEWVNTKLTSSLVLPFSKDGDYQIKVSAKDKAGNEATEKSIQFTVDNVEPKIAIKNVSHNSFYGNDRTMTIEVQERNFNSNNVTIEATRKNTVTNKVEKINIGEWRNTGETSELSYTFTEEYEYSIKVSAVDAAGNKATSRAVTFTIDKTDPQLNIGGVEHNQHYKTKTATINVTDTNIDLSKTILTVTRNGRTYQNSGLQFKVSQRGNALPTASVSYAFKEEGNYVIALQATDKAGNRTVHENVAFVIDKTLPVVSIDGVDHNSYNPTAKRVTVSVDELNFATNEVDVSVLKDNQAYSMGVWNNSAKVSRLSHNFTQDGAYQVSVSATDKAGNGPATAVKTFTIDTINPVIQITGVENGAYYNTDKTMNVSIQDVNLDVNTIRITRDGRPYSVGNFSVRNAVASLSHTFSQEGVYEVQVEAVDKAGNQSNQMVMFTVDKTAPVITPKFRGENRVIENGEYINRFFTPEFALAESEDTIVSIVLNGRNVGTSSLAATRDMVYQYAVTAVDKAGNQTTMEISFTVDTTMPQLSITGVLDGFFNESITPVVSYSDTNLDESRTSVTLNGRNFASGTTLDQENDYVLKAVVTDLANNVSARTLIFTLDKTAPRITFVEPISNEYFNSSVIPNFLIESLSPYDIISITLNGNPYQLGDPIEEEGKHVLYFEVRDQAGNIKQLSVEFIIDLTAPNVIFEGVTDNERYYEPVDLTILLDNPEDTFQSITINGELFTGDIEDHDGYMRVATRVSEIDTYEVQVEAYDKAGNETNSLVTFEISEKSILVKFYENKPLFAVTLVALLGGVATGGTILVRRRKGKLEDDIVEREE
ncbi:Ig-like domain-containing protein [Bacillus alkalicellulosilyticus]|uniref:Ig-like domain-containing protein n=1 Tax=Alkalihalobacterium alkalicellulosilyticum TaxID=1912214 RepID=UPI000998B9E3|nr:Ig-like domain-containing protein [Bacillus alkalicellulosilyticus]